MAFLDITGVGKRFGTVEALSGISLAVARGAFVALLGPSGCGKTTLLRIVAGLETPSAGRIVVDGEDVTQLPPERRRLAMMFQSFALLPHMTALENVRFPLRMLRRGSVREQRERARAALDLVRLGHLEGRAPGAMSGGQQQRVALARAIVAEPRVLLLDEPLSNLDARLREDMQIELRQLHERLGLTTLFVTHDQEEALSLADRVVLVRRGRIERDGSAADIYDDPRTAFTADFLGAANLVPVELAAEANAWRATFGDGQTVLLPDAPGPGRRLLALRQEDLALGPPGSGLDGRVEAHIPLGGRTRTVVSAGGATLRVLGPRREALRPGAAVGVTLHPATLRWIDDERN